jgi:hypothetical protein
VASVTNEYRALAAATLRYAATLLSEKGQPGSFWLDELAESFESGCLDRVLAHESGHAIRDARPATRRR